MTLTTAVTSVTPELAQLWLDERAPNRNITPSTVKLYARDMISGNWLLSGEPIIFNEAGLLIDGQHRLSAVVLSETTVEMLIVGNVDAAAFSVIDQGKSRNLNQVLDLKGYANSSRLAQTLRAFMALTRSPVSFGYRYSTAECQAVLNDNPHILTLLEAFGKMPGSDSTVMGCVATLWKLNPDKAIQFATALATGANLPENDPRLVLLRTLSAPRRANATSFNRMWVAAIVIKAWNDWLTHTERINNYGWKPKEKAGFPKPIKI